MMWFWDDDKYFVVIRFPVGPLSVPDHIIDQYLLRRHMGVIFDAHPETFGRWSYIDVTCVD